MFYLSRGAKRNFHFSLLFFILRKNKHCDHPVKLFTRFAEEKTEARSRGELCSMSSYEMNQQELEEIVADVRNISEDLGCYFSYYTQRQGILEDMLSQSLMN